MIDNPLVSVGLPVFNGEKYLSLTLNSILAQNYKNFELIISDNASTDGTQEICQEYCATDSRIIYHRNEKNYGAAPNHNIVFNLAKGKYFKWSGYDDLIAQNFVSKCVEILESYKEVVLCMPNSLLIDEIGMLIGEFDYQFSPHIIEPHRRFKDLLFHLKTGNLVYGLTRSEIIRQTALHGSYPSSDLVFLAELGLYGQFYIVPEPLFFRRNHPEQSTKGIHAIERNRVAWFDTSFDNKISLPKWQYLFGYIRAINSAPLGIYQQIYCYLQMLRWSLMLPHIKALGKDVILAMNKLFMLKFINHKNISE